MNYLLGGNKYILFGFELAKDLFQGRDWTESGTFPRVTLCDFDLRRLGNMHRYTVQCMLSQFTYSEIPSQFNNIYRF